MLTSPWPLQSGYDSYDITPGLKVAVATLGGSMRGIEGAAIVGPLMTENLGIERIISNCISNTDLRTLILCGHEVKGHMAAQSMTALADNGIDESICKNGKMNGKIIGSKGAIPYIQNLTAENVSRFREQMIVMNLVGFTDLDEINYTVRRVQESHSHKFDKEPMVAMGR